MAALNEKHHSPKHWNIIEPDEMIEAILYKGKLDKYIATTNLRAFYMELNEVLLENKFDDVLGTVNGVKTCDYFEGQAK